MDGACRLKSKIARPAERESDRSGLNRRTGRSPSDGHRGFFEYFDFSPNELIDVQPRVQRKATIGNCYAIFSARPGFALKKRYRSITWLLTTFPADGSVAGYDRGMLKLRGNRFFRTGRRSRFVTSALPAVAQPVLRSRLFLAGRGSIGNEAPAGLMAIFRLEAKYRRLFAACRAAISLFPNLKIKPSV